MTSLVLWQYNDIGNSCGRLNTVRNKWPAFSFLDATTKNNEYLSLHFHSATVLYYKIRFLFTVRLSSFLNRPHQIIRFVCISVLTVGISKLQHFALSFVKSYCNYLTKQLSLLQKNLRTLASNWTTTCHLQAPHFKRQTEQTLILTTTCFPACNQTHKAHNECHKECYTDIWPLA